MSDNRGRSKGCPKRVAIGSFILATGVAVWLNFILTGFFSKVEAIVNTSYSFLIEQIAQSIFLIWILAGLWVLIYGFLRECPIE